MTKESERGIGVVALLSDFGERDGFVGAMKGAALAVNPALRFADISHDIAPRAILEGALVLASVFDVFPAGTIFIAVVDPGVGGARRALAARAAGRIVVAPDNGLIGPILASRGPAEVRSVTEARFFRAPPHPTFHGRDVFAPVAAHLSLGVPLDALGPAVTDAVALEAPRPRRAGDAIAGEILHIDRFGNLVTNLTEGDLLTFGGRLPVFEIGGRVIEGLSPNFADGSSPLRVVAGSWGYLEIALRDSDAARELAVGVGAAVRATAGGVRA